MSISDCHYKVNVYPSFHINDVKKMLLVFMTALATGMDMNDTKRSNRASHNQYCRREEANKRFWGFSSPGSSNRNSNIKTDKAIGLITASQEFHNCITRACNCSQNSFKIKVQEPII